jgi:hypothetical protein
MRPKGGGPRRNIWKASKDVWKPCNPLKSHKTAKALAIITLTKVTPELDRTGQAGGISGVSAHAGPDHESHDNLASELETEVIVTDEMLSAASEVLMDFYIGDGIYDVREPCLAQMYRAMERSRRGSSPRYPRTSESEQ